MGFQNLLDLVPVVALDLYGIALNGATGSATFLDLFENSAEVGLGHPGLEYHHHVFATTALSSHLDVAGSAGERHLLLVADTGQMLALRAPVRVG